MKINLKDVKQLEVDKACQSILHCNTVDKSHVSQYKDGKFKATVLLADETDVLTAYVNDMEVLELFSLGQPSGPGVQICIFIPKAKYVFNKNCKVVFNTCKINTYKCCFMYIKFFFQLHCYKQIH